ncbi:hypothetical protein [Sediminicola luteus]|uniref:RiboL-PSP-HEPN domain-containing protein n=1 Tax=Sediminicola luteus TaxID=319238 RepID=A0ABV2TSR1_9FLAO
MGYKNFDLIDYGWVAVRFICDSCGTKLISGKIPIPDIDYPDLDVDGTPCLTNIDNKRCPKCGKYHTIHVGIPNVNDNTEPYIEIDGIDKRDILDAITYDIWEEIYDYDAVDAILSTDQSIGRFINDMEDLSQLNLAVFEKKSLQIALHRQIFSGAITCLEDYLSSTLIREVIGDEVNFRKFVSTYHGLKNRKFELGNIYSQLDELYEIVKRELLDVIYHDLPKVKGMYHDTLKVQFPNMEKIIKNIKTRHDIVHRNGKTKGGEYIKLDKEDVEKHIKETIEFVVFIEKQINPDFSLPS